MIYTDFKYLLLEAIDRLIRDLFDNAQTFEEDERIYAQYCRTDSFKQLCVAWNERFGDGPFKKKKQ